MPVQYHVGTSGWHYDHWRERFYPKVLHKTKWWEFYASHFTTVKLNNTFYRLPSEKAVADWYNSSPSGFTFAVKVSRFITHIKRFSLTEAGNWQKSWDRSYTSSRLVYSAKMRYSSHS